MVRVRRHLRLSSHSKDRSNLEKCPAQGHQRNGQTWFNVVIRDKLGEYTYIYLVGEVALAFDPNWTFVRGTNTNIPAADFTKC